MSSKVFKKLKPVKQVLPINTEVQEESQEFSRKVILPPWAKKVEFPCDIDEVDNLPEFAVDAKSGYLLRKMSPMPNDPEKKIKWIGVYTVTQEEYEKWTGKKPSFFKGNKRPVENISWIEATETAKKMGMELPTEEEWVWAAQSGDPNYPNQPSPVTNYAVCGVTETAPVGSKFPNPWGIYDTLGNVWEWTCTEWKPEEQEG